MTYRSLLVLLDQDPLGPVRIASAVKLAKTLDCHLVGVAPTSLVDLPASPEAAASLGELATRVWETLRVQAQEAAERFDAACRGAGLASFESVVDEEDKAASLVRHAHCSDLDGADAGRSGLADVPGEPGGGRAGRAAQRAADTDSSVCGHV